MKQNSTTVKERKSYNLFPDESPAAYSNNGLSKEMQQGLVVIIQLYNRFPLLPMAACPTNFQHGYSQDGDRSGIYFITFTNPMAFADRKTNGYDLVYNGFDVLSAKTT